MIRIDEFSALPDGELSALDGMRFVTVGFGFESLGPQVPARVTGQRTRAGQFSTEKARSGRISGERVISGMITGEQVHGGKMEGA